MSPLLWTTAKAFLIALVLTPIFRDIFRSYNVVDRPGGRKAHAYPIPRVGGIPIAIAYLVSLLSVSNLPHSIPDPDSVIWKIVPGATLMFLTGLLDDFFTLRPSIKLAGQVVVAGVVFWGGLRIETIADVTLPMWLSLPVTLFWLLLSTNALNLIDGLDGLCAGMGLVATLTLSAAAALQGNLPLTHATLPLVGALLGFLCYNFNPATVFLGDSGALLIGFLLGCYGMIWTQKAATALSFAVPLLAISIPLLDVSLSVLRRFLQRKAIFGADRGHIHHRLLDRGLSPRRAVLLLYGVAAIGAVFALLLNVPRIGSRYQGLLILGLGVIMWAGIRQLRYREFNLAGRLLFEGGFQRSIRDRIQLDTLETALERARTDDQWWTVLTGVARDAGWQRIRWVAEGRVREEVFLSGQPAWQFRAELSATGALIVEGSEKGAPEHFDLISFAEVIRREHAARQTAQKHEALA